MAAAVSDRMGEIIPRVQRMAQENHERRLAEARERRAHAWTTLYRFYSADDELLYVGIAGNPGRRFANHSYDQPWWTEVASVLLEHFPTRSKAEDAEAEAIWTERPVHNVIGQRGPSLRERALLRCTPIDESEQA